MRPGEPAPPTDRVRDLLRAPARTLTHGDWMASARYAGWSLAGAVAGSLAALLLAALIQPGRPLPLAGGLLDARAGVGARAAAFVAASGTFALLRWWTARLGARLVGDYGLRLRRSVHARLIGAALGALADSTSAEIANVLTYNVEIIAQGFGALQQLLVIALTAAVSLGFAFWLSPPLMLAAPVLAGLGLLASRAYGHEQSRVGRRYVADLTRLFWHSEDFPRRLRHVRSFGREDAEQAGYAAIALRLCRGYRRQVELVASGRLLLELAAAAVIAAAFVLADRWRAIDRASLVAVCLLLGRLLPYLVSTRQYFQQLRAAAPAFALWQRYMALESARWPAASPPAGAGGVLHIERMRVTPPPAGLELADLVLVPGELTVISGDSGIGKSSLVDVLAGMMAPEAFVARLAGRPIGFDAYRELVRHGAYVSQQVRPWQRSVRDCLRWAAPGSSDEALRRALVDVGLGWLLAPAQRGLDTALHDTASRLSGGELQRLLLAQVILRQPCLALLDEATGALDAEAEIAVLAALKRRLPHTILVVVSHRTGVVAMADRCLRIVGGRGVVRAAGVTPERAVR